LRGYNTVVIHPGSSTLRIGRASDLTPLSIPAVVARKLKRHEGDKDDSVGVEGPSFVSAVIRPISGGEGSGSKGAEDEDEQAPSERKTRKRRAREKETSGEPADVHAADVSSNDPVCSVFTTFIMLHVLILVSPV
jgi:actin-related protein